MINRYKTVILWIFMVQLLHAAGFSSTDSLINVPFATSYEPNELVLGASLGYQVLLLFRMMICHLRQIIKLFMHLMIQTNWLTMVNLRLCCSFSTYYYGCYSNDKLAIGVRNITSAPFSTWSYNDDYVESVNMSPYIVQTFVRKNTSFSVGYGLQGFQHSVNTITGLGSIFESFNGLFFGVTYEHEDVLYMAEYDGRDVNLGVRFLPSRYFEINIGLTEQFISSDTNAQMKGPTRQLTFGVISRNIFSHDMYVNNKIYDMNQMIVKLEEKQIELERALRRKHEIESSFIINDAEDVSLDEDLESKVMNHCNFDLYNQRNYDQSIFELHEACRIRQTTIF